MGTGCVMPLRRDCAIFCHAGSERVGGVWSAREKLPWNKSPWLEIGLQPKKGQTVRYIHSPTELSWRGQTVRYIHSPTELSWRGQTVRYIHSPTELSWPGHGEGRLWDTFILPLSYHDLGMERADCEIHSFSHWAIMNKLNIEVP